MELPDDVLLVTSSRQTNVLVLVVSHGAKVVDLCVDLLALVIDLRQAHLGSASLLLKGE